MWVNNMFEFFKRRKKSKAVVGEISDDEFATNVEPAKNEDAKPIEKQPEAPKPEVKPTNEQFQKREMTIEEKAIEMIKHSSLKKYYDLMESSVGNKNAQQLVSGIDKGVSQLFTECDVKVAGNEDVATKMSYAKKVYDYVVKNVEYDPILTQFMRIANDKIYHENINKEILKEVYYELYNRSGTCLADSCVLAYMFEKIGLEAQVIGLGDHAMVELDLGGKKLYCDSVYERGILQGLDKKAIAEGKTYGAGFMQDQTLITDRNYKKDFAFPKMSQLFMANVVKEQMER